MKKKSKNLIPYFSKITLKQIFLYWLILIIVFGLGYFLFSFNGSSYLINNGEKIEMSFNGLLNSIYYSFVTATSTGYGDLTSVGFLKIFSVIEIILGLIMFGLVISKLVSFKQEQILDQIYDISFSERVSRLRSALYLYRSDLARAMENIDSGALSKKKRSDLSGSIAHFNTNLIEVRETLCPPKNDFIKKISDLNRDLLINSIELSLVRTIELLQAMDEKGLKWKSLSMVANLKHITLSTNKIYEYFMERKISDSTKEKLKLLNKSNKELKSLL